MRPPLLTVCLALCCLTGAAIAQPKVLAGSTMEPWAKSARTRQPDVMSAGVREPVWSRSEVRALVDGLADHDWVTQRRSLRRLAYGYPIELTPLQAEQAVPNLTGFLADPVNDREALLVLCQIGRAAAPAVPAVTGCLQAESTVTAWCATQALGTIGGEAAVDALIDTLSDQREAVRGGAAEALGLVGAAAKRAIPVLEGRLRDESDWVRVHAAGSLSRLGAGKLAEGPLARLLGHQQMGVRGPAVGALVESMQADAVLLKALGAEARRFYIGQYRLTFPLSRFRELEWGKALEPDTLLSQLIEDLGSDDAVVRGQAVRLLGWRDDAAPSAMPRLEALLDD